MNIFEASAISTVVQVVPLKALLNLSPGKLAIELGVPGELRYPDESSLGEYSLDPSAPILKQFWRIREYLSSTVALSGSTKCMTQSIVAP